MTGTEILKLLPYTAPFLFVDELTEVNEQYIKGNYTYRKDEFFYKGHFKDNPVTPGVILTETMAQIGLVCFGIYLLNNKPYDGAMPAIALSSVAVDFLLPVLPGEKVTVTAAKKYFRFNKLKCHVQMRNSNGIEVCEGVIAGIIKNSK
jgi:3-hydroxyacyl-[acyl-carrier-protein] dehydratase